MFLRGGERHRRRQGGRKRFERNQWGLTHQLQLLKAITLATLPCHSCVELVLNSEMRPLLLPAFLRLLLKPVVDNCNKTGERDTSNKPLEGILLMRRIGLGAEHNHHGDYYSRYGDFQQVKQLFKAVHCGTFLL